MVVLFSPALARFIRSTTTDYWYNESAEFDINAWNSLSTKKQRANKDAAKAIAKERAVNLLGPRKGRWK